MNDDQLDMLCDEVLSGRRTRTVLNGRVRRAGARGQGGWNNQSRSQGRRQQRCRLREAAHAQRASLLMQALYLDGLDLIESHMMIRR